MKHMPKSAHNSFARLQTILDIIDEAINNRLITQHQAQIHVSAYRNLLIQQICYFNHHKSSSISQANYTRIEKAIFYIIKHASNAPLYILLKEHDILDLYNKGKFSLKLHVAQLTQRMNELQKQHLYFPNERYQDVLYNQIPYYLKRLKTYDAPFHYYHTNQDFDYPLIDDIPLFSNMYHRDGVDLIKEYLRRLSIEQMFCLKFSSSLPELFHQYELQNGILVMEIHMNLFEVLLYQCFANIMLHQKEGVLLSEQNVKELKQMRLFPHLLLKAQQDIQAYIESFSEPLRLYVQKNKNHIQMQWEAFLTSDYQLLIYEQIEEETIHVKLSNTTDSFHKYIQNLDQSHTTKQKIQYIKDEKIAVYDMIDLFDHDIFLDHEYIAYFDTMNSIEVALLITLQIPHHHAFHHNLSFDELRNELVCEHSWQNIWKNYLHQLNQERKEKIKNIVQHIVIDS